MITKSARTAGTGNLRAAVALAIGAGCTVAYANNFTMLDPTGALVGGTNDVSFTWDGTLNNNPATAVNNATLASSTPFFGQNWTAYNVQVYGPGTYTIATTDTAGGPGCPNGGIGCASGPDYTVTVGANQIMAHMKFAWGATEGIDVINVWQSGDWTALNTSGIFTGPGGTYRGPGYNFVSVDWDGDGHAGADMVDGPFSGFSANFNVGVGGGVTQSESDYVVVESTASGSGKMPGCTIGTRKISPFERGDWWLVAGFIGWLAWVRRRTQRQSSR